MKILFFFAVSCALLLTTYTLVSCTTEAPAQPMVPETGVPIDGSATDTLGYIRKYGRTWIYYAEVDKAGNYFRRMFLDSVSVARLRQTGTLPDNALIAMETWFGNDQSTVFIRQKRGGNFENGSFSPAAPNFQVSADNSCNNCHRRASMTDNTFTMPLLVKALQRGRMQRIECDLSSFNPCDLSVYQGN